MEDLILEQEVTLMNEFFIVIGALMSLLLLSIVWIAVLWVPNYEKVREEVSALGKLRDIPKPEIIKMCNLYRMNRDDAEEEDLSTFVMSSRIVKKTYTYQRVSVMCFTFLAMLGFVVVIVIGIHRAAQ
eukprot:TRINITY_DN19587_c0_g1_i1.p1 TRINITY_DN19587_c0_g1~~TRINITY_DN19587_c0_g1_i1.p1  ORF type:complete len:128 (-),score=25.23 TRINITY_DN19587_c0_g1_i1:89-472(-)